MKDTKLIELTNILLEATCNPERWSMVIEKLVQILDAQKGGLEFSDLGSGRTLIQVDFGLGPEFQSEYKGHFGAANPFISKAGAFPLGKVVIAASVIPMEELHKTEFYREFLKPHDIEHLLCAVLFQERGLYGFLNLTRPKQRKPFGEQEAALLQSLIPALQATLLVNQTLVQHQIDRQLNTELLDRFHRGVVLLDGHGKVVSVNRSALAILEGRDGLMFADNGIQAVLHKENLQFKGLLQTAATCGDGKSTALTDQMMLVTRSSSETPLSVLVTPLCTNSRFPFESRARMVVFINDPDRLSTSGKDALRRLYGFTEAEARLAACLLRGFSLEDCSQHLGITVNTTRTHLKRLFTKTSTNRQGELIRVLLESPATLYLGEQQ